MHLGDTDRIYGYGGVMHVSGVGGDFNNTLYKAMYVETKRLLASVIHQYCKVKIDIDSASYAGYIIYAYMCYSY